MDTVFPDQEIETPCPICGHYGIYRKFRKFDLLDHVNKKHSKKIIVGFVCGEAHSSRLWDMDEETCKRKYHNSNIDALIKIFERLKHKSSV
jgi:hypothetical protein